MSMESDPSLKLVCPACGGEGKWYSQCDEEFVCITCSICDGEGKVDMDNIFLFEDFTDEDI